MFNLKPHEKKRGLFMIFTLGPILLITQFFGYESLVFTCVLAGIIGGVSVVLFPDPDFKP